MKSFLRNSELSFCLNVHFQRCFPIFFSFVKLKLNAFTKSPISYVHFTQIPLKYIILRNIPKHLIHPPYMPIFCSLFPFSLNHQPYLQIMMLILFLLLSQSSSSFVSFLQLSLAVAAVCPNNKLVYFYSPFFHNKKMK